MGSGKWEWKWQLAKMGPHRVTGGGWRAGVVQGTGLYDGRLRVPNSGAVAAVGSFGQRQTVSQRPLRSETHGRAQTAVGSGLRRPKMHTLQYWAASEKWAVEDDCTRMTSNLAPIPVPIPADFTSLHPRLPLDLSFTSYVYDRAPRIVSIDV